MELTYGQEHPDGSTLNLWWWTFWISTHMYSSRRTFPFGFCCCDKCYDQKQLAGVKWLHHRLESITPWYIQGYGIRGVSKGMAGAWRQEPQQRLWRSAVCWFLQLPLLYITVSLLLPRDGCTWALISISNRRNASQTCPQVNLMEAISQLRFPLSRPVKYLLQKKY